MLMLNLVVRRTLINVVTIDTNTHKPQSIMMIETRDVFMLNTTFSKNPKLLRFVTFTPLNRQAVVIRNT